MAKRKRRKNPDDSGLVWGLFAVATIWALSSESQASPQAPFASLAVPPSPATPTPSPSPSVVPPSAPPVDVSGYWMPPIPGAQPTQSMAGRWLFENIPAGVAVFASQSGVATLGQGYVLLSHPSPQGVIYSDYNGIVPSVQNGQQVATGQQIGVTTGQTPFMFGVVPPQGINPPVVQGLGGFCCLL